MQGIERINVLLPEVAWHFDQIILFNIIIIIYILFIISCYKLLQWNLAELVEMAMEREREPLLPKCVLWQFLAEEERTKKDLYDACGLDAPFKNTLRWEYRGQQIWHKPMWTCMILHNYVPGVLSRSLSLSAFATFYSGVTFIRILYDCSAKFPSSTRCCRCSWLSNYENFKVFHPWQLDDAGWMLEAGCSGPAAIWNTTTDDHVHRAGPGSSLERCRLDLIWLG